jgi:hypothetical protein
MAAVSYRVARLVALVGLLAGARAAAAEPAWSLAPLPGGRSGLLPRLGLAPDVPPALALGEIIRVVHASRDADAPPAQALREYFAAVPAGHELMPLPLDLKAWQSLLGGAVTSDTLIARLLSDRRASLLCFGLLQLDGPTAAYVAGDLALLRQLYDRHSGILAAFGQSLQVRDGALVLPGGDAAQPAWTLLFGDVLIDGRAALLKLLDHDDGRLIYFVDTIARLDPARQALTFRDVADATPGDRLRSIYRTFTRIEPGWRLGEFPFVRLGADPALLLGQFRIGDTGELRQSRRFWETALGDDSLVKDHRKRWAELGDGDRVEPAWLLDRVTNAALPQRLEAMRVHAFVERLNDRIADVRPADLAYLARGYRRFPALLLSLERLDVADIDVLVRFVQHADRVTAVTVDMAQRESLLALFQAPLALLTRAVDVRAIDEAGTRDLVVSLSRIVPAESGYGRAVGDWIDRQLLPRLGHDPAIEGLSRESTLLEALAGLRSRVASPIATLAWESHNYRVDIAAPEVARLTEVRSLQAGNTLDTALAVTRAGVGLGGDDPVAAARRAAADIVAVLESLEAIEPSERVAAPPPPDVRGLLAAIAADLARLRARTDARRLPAIAERLARAEDALLADVLTSVLYALWLGDPQGQAFLAGNVARRHDYGLRLMTGAERQETPWQLPIETSGSGEPWHMRGALLGLDLGLSRLALRRTRMDLPEFQPTLNESDRRTLVTTLALTNPFAIDAPVAAQVLEWLRAGRRLLATPSSLVQRLDRLGLDGRRRAAVLWTVANAPDDLERVLLRTELVLLGRDSDAPIASVWGAAATPLTGCLCLEFPDPPALDRIVGRAGTGLVTSRMADLKLRVLERLDQLRLPAALVRGVLASALQDYLDEVRPAHGDDWLTLARQVDRIGDDRFDDYVAALTAGGPLVPAAPTATSTNGHR